MIVGQARRLLIKGRQPKRPPYKVTCISMLPVWLGPIPWAVPESLSRRRELNTRPLARDRYQRVR